MVDKLPVLDKGFVRLVQANANDLNVVNSARVSFGQHSDEMGVSEAKLIGFLMRERHGTPFEHNHFMFHVKAPIFVVREWFRHRIGWSYNELSARYTELEHEAYVPAIQNIRTQTGKPGAYTFESMDTETSEDMRRRLQLSYMLSFNTYNRLLADGVAKEVARNVLPVATYTQFYATTNARALMNFFRLRGDSTAQWEIQQYSKAMEEIFAAHMPVTHQSFVLHGREAP